MSHQQNKNLRNQQKKNRQKQREQIKQKSQTKNAQELKLKADKAYNEFDFDEAIKLYSKALLLVPEETSTMNTLGMIFLETGNQEEAIEMFNQSIKLQPSKSEIPYMYLGQLYEEEESVNYFEKGIEILINKLDKIKNTTNQTNNDKVQLEDLTNQIISGLCSLVEIYMTDLCFNTDAEQRCENYVKKAFEISESNFEAYLTLCNLRISQQRFDEAKIALFESISIWNDLNIEDYLSNESEFLQVVEEIRDDILMLKSGNLNRMEHEKIIKENIKFLEQKEEELNEKENEKIIKELENEETINDQIKANLPPLELRIQTCNFLIELGQTQVAIYILKEMLLEQNDDPGIWFLLATAFDHLHLSEITIPLLTKTFELHKKNNQIEDCQKVQLIIDKLENELSQKN
ncbi:lipopolysaccharide assembly protein b [Anaeramoeba flamelloides]|uniref:Lipopolysaccharide assembly protein b n=1 Tax=Anaeramoeba flamelloides TaxID=1746091 RepID=A0AAV7YA82_9EUKA|nr:lipopolysaccharide assembly protein b [Anaeramoeba flamelloides]